MSNNDSNNTSWWSWSTKGVSNIWWHVSSYFKPSVKQIKEAGELGSNDTIALEQTPPAQEQKSTSSWLGNVGGTIYSAAGSFGAGSYNLGSYVLSSGWSVGSAIYSAGYGLGTASYNAVGSTYSAIFSRNKLTNAVEEPKDQGLDHISKDGLKPAEEVVNTAAVEGGAKPVLDENRAILLKSLPLEEEIKASIAKEKGFDSLDQVTDEHILAAMIKEVNSFAHLAVPEGAKYVPEKNQAMLLKARPLEEIKASIAKEKGFDSLDQVTDEHVSAVMLKEAKSIADAYFQEVEVAKPAAVEAGAKPAAAEGGAKTKVATLIAQVEYGDLCDSALFAFPKKWANDVIASYHQAESEPQSHYERVLEGVDQAMLLNYF